MTKDMRAVSLYRLVTFELDYLHMPRALPSKPIIGINARPTVDLFSI